MGEPKGPGNHGGHLAGAYGLDGPGALRDFYDSWAATYDRELDENGYVTPDRCAAALMAATPQADRASAGPVLDIGCGTGRMAPLLAEAGFGPLDGVDLSDGMLAAARARGLYRSLENRDLAAVPAPAEGAYGVVVAAGVFSPAHAPPPAIAQSLSLLRSGGLMVFSLNDHTLGEPEFRNAIDRLTARGTAEVLFDEYGPHLPGIGLEASVVLLRKT